MLSTDLIALQLLFNNLNSRYVCMLEDGAELAAADLLRVLERLASALELAYESGLTDMRPETDIAQ